MKIASQALTALSGVLRQKAPAPGDLERTIPPIVSPTVILRGPAAERNAGERWSTSGFLQLSQVVEADARSTAAIVTLEPGFWEVLVDVSYTVETDLADDVGFGYALQVADDVTLLGGEVFTLQDAPAVSAQHAQWKHTFSLRSAHRFITVLEATGITGKHRAFIALWANRLLD